MIDTRHLIVDLAALELGTLEVCPVRTWRSPSPELAAVGQWGGPAAGLVELVRGEPGLRLAVGPAVVRGLPTAARMLVMGRSPMTGRVQQGSVGSDLGARLASTCDLVSLRGSLRGPGAVLVIGSDGARLRHLPGLAGAPADRMHSQLEDELGPCASLRVGPAAEAGVRWANLAAGTEPASYVGRGGLGSLLAAHGIKAVAVTTPVRPGEPMGAQLVERLISSPRLIARAAGGTFELAHARAAQADLDVEHGADLEAAIAARRTGRHGCKGCPTPCGWHFETEVGAARGRQGARFSAVHALGQALGLEPDHALELLARCNGLGLDAKEAGVVLSLCVQAGLARAGQGADFEALLERVGRGELASEGASALARELGIGDPTAAGEAVREEPDLAALLGTWAAVRGAEPMRSSAFLMEGGRARLAAALAPLDLPAGAELSHTSQGKGRIVWWHENLAAAVDASGFCAFAAAGVLADGVLSIDELAGWLAGPDADGAELLRRGALLAALVAEVGPRPLSRRAPAVLGEPGMVPEYRALRGLDDGGRLRDEARAEALLAGSWRPRLESHDASEATASEIPVASSPVEPGQIGWLELVASGDLRRWLSPDGRLELELPASLRVALAAAAERWPRAAGLLLDGQGQPLVAVYRDGQRLGAEQRVAHRDRLQLVLTVSGG